MDIPKTFESEIDEERIEPGFEVDPLWSDEKVDRQVDLTMQKMAFFSKDDKILMLNRMALDRWRIALINFRSRKARQAKAQWNRQLVISAWIQAIATAVIAWFSWLLATKP